MGNTASALIIGHNYAFPTYPSAKNEGCFRIKKEPPMQSSFPAPSANGGSPAEDTQAPEWNSQIRPLLDHLGVKAAYAAHPLCRSSLNAWPAQNASELARSSSVWMVGSPGSRGAHGPP